MKLVKNYKLLNYYLLHYFWLNQTLNVSIIVKHYNPYCISYCIPDIVAFWYIELLRFFTKFKILKFPKSSIFISVKSFKNYKYLNYYLLHPFYWFQTLNVSINIRHYNPYCISYCISDIVVFDLFRVLMFLLRLKNIFFPKSSFLFQWN